MTRPRRPPGSRGPAARSGARRPSPRPEGGLGGEQVEGRRAVRELLAAGRRRVRDVWVSSPEGSAGRSPSPGVDALVAEIEDLAANLRIPVRRVSRAQLEAAARTQAPQGVLAHADPLPEADIDDLAGGGWLAGEAGVGTAAEPGARAPFLLVLDGVTDPQNLGALLRTAEAAGATGVLLPRHRAAHITPAVTKAAAGAIEHVPVGLVPGVPAALARLKERGVWTVGLDPSAAQPLFGLSVATEPVALVLGAEGAGLGRLTKERCDLLVAVPLLGRTASLNVAAAGAVACFEVARQRAG